MFGGISRSYAHSHFHTPAFFALVRRGYGLMCNAVSVVSQHKGRVRSNAVIKSSLRPHCVYSTTKLMDLCRQNLIISASAPVARVPLSLRSAPTTHQPALRWKSDDGTIAMTTTTVSNSGHYNDNSNNDSTSNNNHDHELVVGLFKNPIVHQLWTARQAAKERHGNDHKHQQQRLQQQGPSLQDTRTKSSSHSRVEVRYPFADNVILRETYQNPWGNMRLGKMMEDLDALAGNIAYFHVDDPGPTIVTASVDRIRLTRRPTMHSNQRLSGQVTWTGTSSMEICMKCQEDDDELDDGSSASTNPWLEAYVTFVTLDRETKKPVAIPALVPETKEEQASYQAGAARAAVKKRQRQQQQKSSTNSTVGAELQTLASSLLQQAGPLLTMPSLADPHSILMSATRMQNAMVAQPQLRNLHNRIFGGFLMRRAFELAFSNAYVFGGARPIFLEVDEVSFTSPVDVGDLLVFNSRVLYTERGNLRQYYDYISTAAAATTTTTTTAASTSSSASGKHTTVDDTALARLLQSGHELPLVHIEVEAWVTEPEKTNSRLSNQFYFTFAMIKGDANQNVPAVRTVLPSNMDEAQRMAMRIMRDTAQLD